MKKTLKTELLCIAILCVTGLSSSAFSGSANDALPQRPVAPPPLPAFELPLSAWLEEARQDVMIQLDQDWLSEMGQALDGVAGFDQQFAVQTQLRTHLADEAREAIAEVRARTEGKAKLEPKTESLASN